MVRSEVMRRVLYVLATIGYIYAVVTGLWPTLCIGEPFWEFAFMGIFASVAIVCGKGAQQIFPALALIVALAGSIHAYRHNQRVIAAIREHWRRGEIERRQWVQQMETNTAGAIQTNQVDATQTNQFASREPELSPFNCCP